MHPDNPLGNNGSLPNLEQAILAVAAAIENQRGVINNPYCFSAYASGATTLTDNTIVTIALATEIYDLHDDFASNTYTAPVDGIYHFDGCFQIDGAVASGVTMQAFVYVNGSAVLNGDVFVPTNFGAASVSGDILLDAGDTVIFRGKQDSGGGEATAPGLGQTRFNGHLIHQIF